MWVTFQLHQRHLILIVLIRMKVPWQVRERSMNKLTLSSSFVLLWSCRSCSRRCRISSTKSRHIIKKPHLQPRTQTEPWCEFRFPTWRTPTNTKISIEGVGGSHFKTVKSCFLGSLIRSCFYYAKCLSVNGTLWFLTFKYSSLWAEIGLKSHQKNMKPIATVTSDFRHAQVLFSGLIFFCPGGKSERHILWISDQFGLIWQTICIKLCCLVLIRSHMYIR